LAVVLKLVSVSSRSFPLFLFRVARFFCPFICTYSRLVVFLMLSLEGMGVFAETVLATWYIRSTMAVLKKPSSMRNGERMAAYEENVT
jgi:hypothetical protein